MKNFLQRNVSAAVFCLMMIAAAGQVGAQQAPAAQKAVKPATPAAPATPHAAAPATPSAAPQPVDVTEVELLRVEVQLKDFEIAQIKFAQLIETIKKAHGWGDDVMYDFSSKKFYRLPKATATK